MSNNIHGYCPYCCAGVKRRERRINGNDICENDHEYPSKLSTEEPDFDSATKNAVSMLDSALESGAAMSYDQLDNLNEWLGDIGDRMNEIELTGE